MAPSGALCPLNWALVEGGPDLHPLGSPGCLLNLVQERGIQFGMTFLDGTNVRAYKGGWGSPKRGSQAQRDDREALGRSRGGYDTKACVIAGAFGRAIAFRIAPGQAHGLPDAIPLLPTPSTRC